MPAAAHIVPQLNLKLAQQGIAGVTVCAWPNEAIMPAANVLETFSCGLPLAYLEKMVAQQSHWINLDYLSAEDWVADFHGKPSPQAQLPITKHFFFPGFEINTGGLLRERDLIAKRIAYSKDAQAQSQFWQALGCEQGMAAIENSLKISLFCYPQANVPSLLTGLHSLEQAVTLFFPASLLHSTAELFPDFARGAGLSLKKQHITVQPIPFLSQANYDRLLWSCDCNFVRGEDSWVRAIWAGQAFIWQPYIQEEGLHLKKMQAFLDRYSKQASPELSTLISAAHYAWSDAQAHDSKIFTELMQALSLAKQHALAEANRLAQQPDLLSKLLSFNEKLTENKV
jgi:uncharacterized repeat protein (TIGR03837 family)